MWPYKFNVPWLPPSQFLDPFLEAGFSAEISPYVCSLDKVKLPCYRLLSFICSSAYCSVVLCLMLSKCCWCFNTEMLHVVEIRFCTQCNILINCGYSKSLDAAPPSPGPIF